MGRTSFDRNDRFDSRGAPADLYQGERGERYFERQHTGGMHAAWNRFIWDRIVRDDDELLEFGCGGGQLLSELSAKRKVGVEINPAAASHARSLGLEIHADFGRIDDASFSKVISSHALEHVASPFETLRELRRVLKPSGELALLLPLDDWRDSRQRSFAADDPDMHLHTWTPLTLGNLLVAAGFAPSSVEVVNHCFPPRLGEQMWSRSKPLFHFAAKVTAVILRRRQLLARARVRPVEAASSVRHPVSAAPMI